jgi:O-antigen/teichoic acid export membrane protein
MTITTKRVVYWIKEASRFFSLQLVVTAFNFLVGFLILRSLSKIDYATYTAALSILSIFTNVTNVGIGPAMNDIAGKHHADRIEMGALVNTAVSFRNRVAVYLAVPILCYAGWQFWLLNVSILVALFVIAIVAVGGVVQLQISILKVPLLFARRVIELQRIELKGAVVKLLLGGGVILIYPSVITFSLVMSVVFLYIWRLTVRAAGELYDKSAPIRAAYRKQIVDLFRANFINTLYWAFQGQILILLCALFGSTENVAEIGAMGKITAVFTLLNLFVNSYFIPAVAKEQSPRAILVKSYQVVGFYIAAAVPILMVAFLFPDVLLMILGEKYANLTDLLPLYVSISVLTLFQGAFYSLCAAKGWVRYYFVYTPIIIITQVTMLFFFDLSDMRSILYFDGALVLTSLLITVVLYTFEYTRYRNNFLTQD